ncbi:hypothetical protein GJ744_007917 [Endocarpon pusillum]|uniref:Uncharacterized protein n=1 Tax=Endocarpon pusillum TaxID=364733 RepID=A0A8H7E4X9_9EURO|nr:hypothetical protein GJ744_007917 [Endocarpon pusillum]
MFHSLALPGRLLVYVRLPPSHLELQRELQVGIASVFRMAAVRSPLPHVPHLSSIALKFMMNRESSRLQKDPLQSGTIRVRERGRRRRRKRRRGGGKKLGIGPG